MWVTVGGSVSVFVDVLRTVIVDAVHARQSAGSDQAVGPRHHLHRCVESQACVCVRVGVCGGGIVAWWRGVYLATLGK